MAAPGVPALLNFQGKVVVGATPFHGTGQFKFALVSGDGATTFWSNNGTSAAGSEPTAAVSIAVVQGIYAVQLGDTSLTNMTAVPASAFTQDDVRLRVWFNDGTTGSQLLAPDQRVAAVGYAMLASTVPDGAITMPKIAAGAVGSAQIAAGAVGSTHLAAGSVGSTQLAAGAVGAAQLAAGAVGATQMAPGSIGFSQLAKPPQAGVVMIDPLQGIQQSVTFPQAYAVAPVVTITPGFSAATSNPTAALVSSTATGFTAQVKAQLTPQPIGSPGVKGDGAPMQFLGGNPAFAYSDWDTGDLMFIRATNAAGTTWAAPVTILAVTSGLNRSGPVLQIVNGRPAIIYTESTTAFPYVTQIKYLRATDANGTAWGTPVIVANPSASPDKGYEPNTLFLVNGRPAVAFIETDNNTGTSTVNFVRANDADGTAFGTLVPIASGNNLGGVLGAQVVNGRPAVVYREGSNLKFARATDADGTAFGAPATIAAGYGDSLQIVNGNPALAFSDNNTGYPSYIRATDADGTAWGPIVSIVDNNSPDVPTLRVVNGRPALSFLSYSDTSISIPVLRYQRSDDVNGTSFAPPLTLLIGNLLGLGTFSPLQEINGQPAIPYSDGNTGELLLLIGGGTFPLNWIALPQ